MFFQRVVSGRAKGIWSRIARDLFWPVSVLVSESIVCSAILQGAPKLTAHEELIERANLKKPWESRAWRKLLFIPDRILPSDTSLVDDPQFFLSPDGRTDPKAEFFADLDTLLVPQPEDKTTKGPKLAHPRCRFPARLSYIIKELDIDPSILPTVHCEDLDKFLDFADYSGISLVFSSYYVNNPGSMFGHTFLRLHRGRTAGNETGLMDDVASFSAFVPDSGSLLYPFKGLAGFYPGRFSLLPYYRKIQEYSNYESRDLWEYELNFTADEIRRLSLVLWEVGPIYMDYFYLDDNCAYVLLSTLEAAKPALDLTDQLWVYAVPTDTVRVVTRTDGLVKGVNYRPSSLGRFKFRHKQLTTIERDVLDSLVGLKEDFNWASVPQCGKECKMHVTDAAIEYIDYEEKLAGSLAPQKLAKFRTQVLLARANLGLVSKVIEATPDSSAPDTGHDAGLISLGIGKGEQSGPFSEFQWRPALHDLSADGSGYSEELAIGFLDTTARFSPGSRRLVLDEFHPIEIMSLPDDIPYSMPIAWHLDLGWERNVGTGMGRDVGREYFQFGVGQSKYLLNRRVRLYSLLHADMGYAERLGWHIGPMLATGAIYRALPKVKVLAQSELARRFGLQGAVNSIRSSLILSTYLKQNQEGRLEASLIDDHFEAMICYLFYH